MIPPTIGITIDRRSRIKVTGQAYDSDQKIKNSSTRRCAWKA